MTAEPDVCAVCGDPEPDRRLLQDCFRCGRRYHLNPYSNRPGRDCGDAVLAEEFGLHYYCQPCLEAMDAEFRGSATAETVPVAPPPPPRRLRPTPRRRYRRIDR